MQEACTRYAGVPTYLTLLRLDYADSTASEIPEDHLPTRGTSTKLISAARHVMLAAEYCRGWTLVGFQDICHRKTRAITPSEVSQSEAKRSPDSHPCFTNRGAIPGMADKAPLKT